MKKPTLRQIDAICRRLHRDRQSLDRALFQLFPPGAAVVVSWGDNDAWMPGTITGHAHEGILCIRAKRGKRLIHRKHFRYVSLL